MYIQVETFRTPDTFLFDLCAKAARLSHKSKKTLIDFTQQIGLLMKLVLHGDDEAKSLRGLQVYYSLTAPRYFWQEFCTYRVGNEQLGSESTMHSAPKFESESEFLIYKNEIKEGMMQTRYFMTNYQTLRRMYFARRNHRLPHWREFCTWIETLPYAKELIIGGKNA
jgi:hypothetical protein